MNLVRRHATGLWDPFRELQEMADRVNRLLNIEDKRDEDQQTLTAFDWAPAVNISETDNAYLVKADLPDVKKEDVKVTHDNGVLTIEGERRQERREENEKVHRVESSYGRFLRRFTIPENVEDAKIEASFKDGALNVRIPKAAAKTPKARQISVS